jgi:alkylation response protein AidB-like acyl-CoA dehydrogenase
MNHGAQVDFELTEEQAALREVSRGLLAVNCPPQLVRSLAAAGQDTDEKLWQRGAELGWTGLAVPEELDGAGQGVVELCLVAEELGRAAVPGPFLDSALTALALARAGRRADLVGSLAAGDVKASLAHHGAVTGSWDGDELVLGGRSTAVQAAASADWLLVTVAVDQGRRLVLVPSERARVESRRTLDETRRWYDVVFDGVRVPAADVVTADEAEVRWLADVGAVLTAADSLGVGERLLEMTVGYVKVREQFGRPIGSFQSVKHKATDMLTTLKGAAALAGEALQTHGGIGFTWEHDLHLYLRRAKVNEVLYGAAAEHYERLVALRE